MTTLSKIQTSPRALAIAIVAVLLVLTAATWFVLLSPKRNQANSLSAQINAAHATLQTHKGVSHRASSRVPQSLFVRRALPTSVAIPQVVLELSRIASDDHVSFDGITPAAPTPYSGFDAVPISIVVSGRFFNIEAFLRDLRNQVSVDSGEVAATGRLFDVQSVNLVVGTQAPLVSATLAIDVFNYSPAPAGATTTGSPT